MKNIRIILYAFAASVLCFTVALSVLFPVKYTRRIKSVCDEYGVDYTLVQAVVLTESGYNRSAVSRVGAQGLMQLMPSTAVWIASQLDKPELASDLYDADNNITLGVAYLSYLIKKFGLPDALAAYNAGEGNLSKWKNNGLSEYPFYETRNYVKKVLKAQRVYKTFKRR